MDENSSKQVFISYNSVDSVTAESIVETLTKRFHISCWLDSWSLVPGEPWQEHIEAALQASEVMVLLIGAEGFGPWHNEEMRVALDLRTAGAKYRRVIPVLLPGWHGRAGALPYFLRRLTWVDMREGFTDTTWHRLVAGITGRAPREESSGQVGLDPPDHVLTHSERQLLDRVDEIIPGACTWVRRIQNSDGGLPSDGAGSMSCTWTTAGLVWSLWDAGTSFTEPWMRRALSWVLDNRNDDDGVPIVVAGDPSISEATAQTALACAACYVDTGDERYRSALASLTEWLVVHQETNAGWSWRPGREPSWGASTAYAVLALLASIDLLPEDRGSQEALAGGSAWIEASRNDDFGWGTQKGLKSSPVITGLMMHALVRLGRPEMAKESVPFLRQTQLGNGHWPDTVDRPTGHTVPRFDDAYCVLGLVECVGGLDDMTFRQGFDGFMASYVHPHFRYLNTVMDAWPTRDGLLVLSAIGRRLGSDLVRQEAF
jgi:hypothetical protein